MKKTYQLHLRIEIEAIERLKKQAYDKNITLAEICRIKMRQSGQLDKLDYLVQKLEKLLSKDVSL
ncbi:MAG: hypothetical protein ACP5NS_01355 [Candidatus Pacearchaeota archaeon]